MTTVLLERKPDAETRLGFVDCDVHPTMSSPLRSTPSRQALAQASSRSGRHMRRARKALELSAHVAGTGMRIDTWPTTAASRLRPGVDAGAACSIPIDVAYGMMLPLRPAAIATQRRVRRGDGDGGERLAARSWCGPEPRLKAGPGDAGIHRSRDHGDREARRRPPFHAGDDPAARAGAAGPPPLLADP